jgi:hypothetical protein
MSKSYFELRKGQSAAIKICSCCQEVCCENEATYVDVRDKDNKYTILLCQNCLDEIRGKISLENDMYGELENELWVSFEEENEVRND